MSLAVDLENRATDALLQWRGRDVFPTDLGSAEIAGFSRELRLRSIFSARTTNADYLSEIAAVVDDVLAGKINMADGRLRLFRKLRQLGYDPEIGFPQDMAAIPPAERGSLRDLSSISRLNLVLETNVRIATNYGRMVAGNTPYARWAYPAWELVRLYQRHTPRGSLESHSAGWAVRWNDAGRAVEWEGALMTPMVGLKDSPIWAALGEGAGGYQDALSNPFPPFAFNSGMAWRAVERERCVELGLITGEEVPGEMRGALTPAGETVNRIFERLPADLQEEMRRELEDDNEAERLRVAQAQHEAAMRRRRDARVAQSDADREAGRRMIEGWMR